jgi:class 3 adenylate cyclase
VKLRLAFADPDLERAFADDQIARQRTTLRAGALVAFVGFAGFMAWDWLMLPFARTTAWLGAYPFFLAAAAAMVGFTFAREAIFSRLWPAAVIAFGWIFCGALLALQAALPREASSRVYNALVIGLVTSNALWGLRFAHAALANSVVLLAYVLLVYVFVPLPRAEAADHLLWVASATLLSAFVGYQLETARRQLFLQRRTIAEERAKSEQLLRNVLPEAIAERLKREPGAIADGFDAVTVLFADIVGFTPLASEMAPRALVELLNEVFSAFDEMARRHGLEKIKTIGDAYMVVGGLPTPRADHARAVAAMALEMRDAMARLGGGKLALRIGLHSGPVVAGVIGTSKYSYDLWGDTVNTASRMESHGAAGAIHVSEACRAALGDELELEPRGAVEIKGKGTMRTFWLVRARRA